VVLLVLALCSDVVGYHCLEGPGKVAEGGGSIVLQNVGILPHHCTVSEPIAVKTSSHNRYEQVAKAASVQFVFREDLLQVFARAPAVLTKVFVCCFSRFH